MTKTVSIQFALHFPQGHILFLDNGGAYFKPHGRDDAHIVYGERKELFGKKAITVGRGAEAYSVVYEFNTDGEMTDARLVTPKNTVFGRHADTDTVRALNEKIAQGSLTLYTQQDTQPETIFNVARFNDGRLLIQLYSHTLYLGTPGNYEKVDAQHTVQGGGSNYYRLASGGTIALPYSYGGPRNNEVPTFGDDVLCWVTNVKHGAAPETLGLALPPKPEHLTPFSPEVWAPSVPQGTPAAPKPPAR